METAVPPFIRQHMAPSPPSSPRTPDRQQSWAPASSTSSSSSSTTEAAATLMGTSIDGNTQQPQQQQQQQQNPPQDEDTKMSNVTPVGSFSSSSSSSSSSASATATKNGSDASHGAAGDTDMTDAPPPKTPHFIGPLMPPTPPEVPMALAPAAPPNELIGPLLPPALLRRENSTLSEEAEEEEEENKSTDKQATGKKDDKDTTLDPAVNGSQSPKRNHDEMNGKNNNNNDNGSNANSSNTEERGRRLEREPAIQGPKRQRTAPTGLFSKTAKLRRKAYANLCVRSISKSRSYHLDNTKSAHLQSFHAGDSRIKFRRLTNTDWLNVNDALESLCGLDLPESEFALNARVEFEMPAESFRTDLADGTLKVSVPNDTHRCIGKRLARELYAKVTGSYDVPPSRKKKKKKNRAKGSVYVLDKRTKDREEMYVDRGFWFKDSMYKFYVVPDGALLQKGSKVPFLVVDVLTAPTYSCQLERAATYILGSNGGVGLCVIVSLYNCNDVREKGVYTHASASVFERDKSATYNIVATFKDTPVYPECSETRPITIRCGEMLKEKEEKQNKEGEKEEAEKEEVAYPDTVEVSWEELAGWVAVSFEQTGQPKKGGYFYETDYDYNQVMKHC